MIVPQKGRRLVLEELHESQTGSSKIKSLARTYVWWPKMDADIVETAKSCSVLSSASTLTCFSTATSMGVARDTLESTAS